MTPRFHGRGLAAAALLVAMLAACSGGGTQATLQSVAIGAGRASVSAAVGVPHPLSLVGKYSDGTSAALTTGVTWSSSDETIASVDEHGRILPWRSGDGVTITARHDPTGLTATTSLSCRDVVRATGGSAPISGSVDRSEAFFRISGLQAGVLYTAKVTGMSDDVDMIVYEDLSMTSAGELCASDKVGKYDESCVAPANAAGELWITIDGGWTNAGARFALAVVPTQAVPLAGTLAFPAQLPRQASIGPVLELYKVTGLAPLANYEVKLSQMTADIDVQVYGDAFEYRFLCASYNPGTADDACTARSTASGELFVAISGETSAGGGSYALGVIAK